MTLRWPDILAPKDLDAHLTPRPIGGVPTFDGTMQWVQSDMGCWSINYGSIPVAGVRPIKCFRALDGILNGPATPILIPVFDDGRAPWPLDGGGNPITPEPVPHSDGAFFSDGSGYMSTMIAATADAADLRATSLSVTISAGGDLLGGEFFSIGENLYGVTTVEVTDAGPPIVYTMGIKPPLREAISGGTALNFDTPAQRCVLADSFGMPLSIDTGVIGRPSLAFIEDFSGA